LDMITTCQDQKKQKQLRKDENLSSRYTNIYNRASLCAHKKREMGPRNEADC
jgi:hypothetical protein